MREISSVGIDITLNRGEGGVVIFQGPHDQVAPHADQSASGARGVIMVDGESTGFSILGLRRFWSTAYRAAITLLADLLFVFLHREAIAITEDLRVRLFRPPFFGVSLTPVLTETFLAGLPMPAGRVGSTIKVFTLFRDLAPVAGDVFSRFGFHHGSQHTPSTLTPLTPVMV